MLAPMFFQRNAFPDHLRDREVTSEPFNKRWWKRHNPAAFIPRGNYNQSAFINNRRLHVKSEEKICVAGELLPLRIHRHPRARKITLRHDPLNDSVSLTFPWRISLREAMRFLQSRTEWLERQRSIIGPRVVLREGMVFTCIGESLTISSKGSVRGISEIRDGIFFVAGAPEHFARRAREYLHDHLHTHVRQMAQNKASVIGKTPGRIRVREVGSCWGSCSPSGDLTFSWRLIFAPPEVLEYLVSHEVAHLKEMNHSPRFWKVVARLCPDWQSARAWLREHGQGLYAYQF